MKERPILFSAEMVRAILDGRKHQTRRVIKPQPARVWHSENEPSVQKMNWKGCTYRPSFICCPYGQPGDRLWVKETFLQKRDHATLYRATTPMNDSAWKWKPSIFMPRKLSRITLKITKIRVERLTEISVADCLAEGIQLAGRDTEDVRAAFKKLWDSINGVGAWDKNPWVWVIDFKR